MTPPTAATVAARQGAEPRATSPGHRRSLRRSPAPRVARRVSGPGSRGTARRRPAAPSWRAALHRGQAAASTLTRRVGLGGFVGGRLWIGVFAGLLLGLVFLQVSLLKLNTAISLNVERAQALERSNAGLRSSLDRLDAGQRIQDVAARLGMVMPGPGAVCYLEARAHAPCSGGDAAAADTASDPTQATVPAADAQATSQSATTTSPAPATTQPAAASAPVSQAPAQAQQAPAQTQAADPPPAQTPAAATGGVSAAVGG